MKQATAEPIDALKATTKVAKKKIKIKFELVKEQYLQKRTIFSPSDNLYQTYKIFFYNLQ